MGSPADTGAASAPPDDSTPAARRGKTRCVGDGAERERRPSRTSRWRAAVLIAVHVAFAIHITQWLTSESRRTISPVEPSESMYFLERGDLNAGAIFFATTLLLTAIFGRFFCGWACHVVALQDLCAAWMKRCGVRPKLFKSRLLMFVPLIIGLEMFVFPVFKLRVLGRIVEDPDWRVWFDGMTWNTEQIVPWSIRNEIVTTGFWDTFAGPWMAIPFLFICGFAVVYFLGAKGFCTYGCPYGAFFAGMDRIAPGKIVANLDTCEKCGECSAHCTSNVRVHEEIQDWGKVVSAGCMKCMDCVSVCPTGSLSFGFAKPLVFSKRLETKKGPRPKRPKRFDLTLGEEIGLFILFFWIRYAWRGGPWGIPMLMATGIAGCLTFLAWKALRLRRDHDVSFHRFALKRGGVTRPIGKALTLGAIVAMILTGSLFIAKWNHEQGAWQMDRLSVRGLTLDIAFAPGRPEFPPEVTAIAERGVRNTARLQQLGSGGWTLYQPDDDRISQRLGYFKAMAGDLRGAKEAWEGPLADDQEGVLAATYAQLIERLCFEAFQEGGFEALLPILEDAVTHATKSPFLTHRLSLVHAELGNLEEAERWRARANELQQERNRRMRAAAAGGGASPDPHR